MNVPPLKDSCHNSYTQILEDLAVDWVANNLYWTDTLNRKLEVLDIDSTHTTTLIDTGLHTAPRAIVVDPNTRYCNSILSLSVVS